MLSNREARRHKLEHWQAGVHVLACGTSMSVAMVTPQNIHTQHNVIFLIKFEGFDFTVWRGCDDVNSGELVKKNKRFGSICDCHCSTDV